MVSMEEGIEVLVEAIAEIVESGEGHAHGEESEDDEAWMDAEESPRTRYRRYIQSGQDEVSDPDDWARFHYGPYTPASTRREMSRSRETSTPSTPMPRAMPKILADRRNQRLAGEEGEAMVRQAEAAGEGRGV